MINISSSITSGQVAGNGQFTKKVQQLLNDNVGGQSKTLLTTSCTHALEMSAILLDLQAGDEVIVPSFTFVSSALAFVMHGGTPVFADIRPDTLNIDENRLESLITPRTRAIVVVHYAGVACEMDTIMEIASRHNLVIIEDNAHGLFGKYRQRSLGSIGHMATQSFHESKNFTCGEGGALIVNDSDYFERAEIIWEKGTNRANFFRGQVDKYTWIDKGSSYLLADILAACLYGQLAHSEEIQGKRKAAWDFYYEELADWAADTGVVLPHVPAECDQAYHMFYVLMPTESLRSELMRFLRTKGISTTFHYIPLHDSPMGEGYCSDHTDCEVTSSVSGRLMRLPFFTDITRQDQRLVVKAIREFRSGRNPA